MSHPSWNMVMQKLVMIGRTLINLCECSASVLLHQPALHLIFSYWVVKAESGFIVRSVEIGLGR